MTKERAPFKSGVTDFDALRTRMDELGILPVVGGKNGVDVSKPTEPATNPTDGGYYG